MLLMSLQQPWHPAWSRQWIPQSTNAKWCWSRPLQTNKQTEKGTQTNGNDKMWPPADTKHEDRRDVIYLSSARRRCKCYLPQPKAVTSAMRLIAPRDKKKRLAKTQWMEMDGWSYCYRCDDTRRREHFVFQKWGGRQTHRMLSRQRRENSVHSTFSTSKEWKRKGVNYVSKFGMLIMVAVSLFFFFSN